MKKLKLAAILAGFVAISTLAWSGLASAHVFRTGTNVLVGQKEIVNNTIFAAGRTIDINSEVYGDVFCAGQNVTVSGIVHGDVICAGQTVRVSGTVDGDIRLAGQTVNVSANVSGNATIAGQTFTLESTGRISGDLSVGSNDGVINGSVGRDIAGGGENLVLASTVGRDVRADIGNLQLLSTAKITGNVDYTSRNQVDRAEGSFIGGRIIYNEPAKSESSKVSLLGLGVAWFVFWFLALLILALVLALLFPTALRAITNQALPHPWKSLLAGFLAGIVVPVVLIFLTITIVGIPLGILAGLGWMAALILSFPLSGYYLGRHILKNSKHPVLVMLVGAGILAILYLLPFIGFIFLLAGTWLGSGMLLLEVFHKERKHHKTSAPAKAS